MRKHRLQHILIDNLSIMVVILLGMAFGQTSAIENHSTEQEIDYSETLRRLLVQEMAALQTGMQTLSVAIPAGQWTVIEDISQNMADSFVLQQELTPELREELHQSVPPGFVRLDRSFHADAGSLAQVARERKKELTAFYYYRLLDKCVSCHSIYLPHRFPGYSSSE